MSQTASQYINSPVSGTQYFCTMATGVVWASADTTLQVHVKAWSGANGTGSLVTCTTMDAWVWDQTANAAKGHFSGSTVNSVAAQISGATNGDYIKCSGQYTGSGVGSLEMFITYTQSSLFIPTQPTFSPSAGGVGTSVTLTGTHFTDAGTVTLNGVSCSFSVTNDTTISATVPSGATTGPFIVGNTNGNSPASASNFLVANAYVMRSGVWTPGVVDVERSSVQTTAQGVFVFRSSSWVSAQ